MACIEMYNSENPDFCPPMSPRISFSNDFVESHQLIKHERNSRPPPPPGSSDFEFTVSDYSMMSADELFCKGKFLPFRQNFSSQKTTTLRDELLVEDDGDATASASRPPKSSTKWKAFLGLKRSHTGSKKPDKPDGFFDRAGEARRSSGLVHEPFSYENSQVKKQ